MLKTICQEHLEGRYDLEVIDVYQHPQLAAHSYPLIPRPGVDNGLVACVPFT